MITERCDGEDFCGRWLVKIDGHRIVEKGSGVRLSEHFEGMDGRGMTSTGSVVCDDGRIELVNPADNDVVAPRQSSRK